MWKTNETSLKPPSLISSTTNIVRVNYSVEKRGLMNKFESFRMEWIMNGCGGVLKQYKGEFTSPEYPKSSPVNSTCEWNIIAEYGSTIEITMNDFSFESTSPCSSGFLSVRLTTIIIQCFETLLLFLDFQWTR